MARPRRQIYTMKQYLDNEKEGYITNNVSIQRNPAWKPIIDGLVVTILTDDYIPPIILAEDGSGRTVIVDGGSRTTAFKMIRYGNHKIKSSVESPIIKYKKMEKDKNGEIFWSDAEFDIRNKTFEKFPKELQKKFDEYQVETVIHECDIDAINKYFRRYNIQSGMTANQKMFIYLPKFADEVKKITNRQFFLNYSNFNDNEKEKGMLERVVSESVMCMFHLESWNKQGKRIATYLNENSSKEEFNKLNDNLGRLEKIITKDTKTLFNNKNCFIWLTLFDRFTKLGLDDSKFASFIEIFVKDLRNKPVDNKLFDKADEDRSTKDKSVINDKLHILETLMREYLHIEESKPVTKEEFIAENVELPIDDVKEDMSVYEDTLKDLRDNAIRDGSKLLNEENRLSLLAMVAYSYKHDIDLDEWMEEYAANNNTYFVDQKKNFCHMIEDLNKYTKRKAVA